MTMLLSCPFCGGREQARADADDTWWLVCRDCGACGPVQHRGGDKFTWNTRALSQPGAGDIETMVTPDTILAAFRRHQAAQEKRDED